MSKRGKEALLLFRPVYGPELEALWSKVSHQGHPVSKQDIYQDFLPQVLDNPQPSTQNIDDALTFLVSARLLLNQGHQFTAHPSDVPFNLILLRSLCSLANGTVEPSHPADRLYLGILDELFIRPNQLFVTDIHRTINSLRSVKDTGGLSQEKVRSWCRVMAHIGLGRRLRDSFQCIVSSSLMLAVYSQWEMREGSIQAFLEDFLVQYVPFQSEAGGLAIAVEQALLHLEVQGHLVLSSKLDSSAKPYVGDRQLRYISPGA